MNSISKERRSEIMRRIGRQDTPPERAVRRILHRLGLRFRLHARYLRGKPDIVLRRWKTVVFVHGCFWHGCPQCFQGHRVPKTNRTFWLSKIEKNRSRDERTREELRSSGWRVVTMWECETADEQAMTKFLKALFSQSKSEGGTGPQRAGRQGSEQL